MIISAMHADDGSNGALLESLAHVAHGRFGCRPVLDNEPAGRIRAELVQDIMQMQCRLHRWRSGLLRDHVLASPERGLDGGGSERDGEHDQHDVDLWVIEEHLHLCVAHYAAPDLCLGLCHRLARAGAHGLDADREAAAASLLER